MRALAVVALALAGLARAALPDNAADLPLAHLLQLAQDSLAQGKSSDALALYDHCLERDPSDFATLYKRASVRLAAGHLAKAKDAFLDVLAQRDYHLAHLQLAKVHAKLAEYDDAKAHIDTFLRAAAKDKGNHDKDLKEAQDLRKQVLAAHNDYLAAQKALARSPPDLDRCLSSSSSAIHVSPQALELRLVRAECALLAHDFDAAIGDLSRASSLSPTLPQYLLVRIALLSALFTDHGLSVPVETHASLKRCLAADPDSKTCAKPLKALKKLEKELAQLRNWVEAGRWTEAAVNIAGGANRPGTLPTVKGLLETYQQPVSRGAPASEAPLPQQQGDAAALGRASPLLRQLTSTLCRAYVSLNSRKAAAACRDALALDPEDTWGLVGRADELMKEEDWDEAVRVLSAAFEATGRSDRAVLERLQKAQRLLKQSKSKDYYKILGVSRDADDKTIKRAYRKATLKAHPDKEGGSEEKMAALNEAYEVISNPELRARFDAGEDPNDPHSGHGGFGQGHPGGHGGGQPIFFQQGGSPFGAGGGGGAGGFQQFFQQAGGAGGGQQFQFRWG